ncbi:hypothetical protein DR_0655 [Deinococcus radiodurans R1 = ATCC 13939 = DSM 20539]|uniref:Uncharacterized protein n=1 Tax=Deinococcus radiodurans (strain ATCC 13939 / DSM 20539 / JCM 16871 / CCUG 27074 / LMG 4051 / NBRC 15346 / NCIMB 9279 / VKM B-1422 / R1) TaxID=243230 RepID=Q9RWL1_DEIRA|nr:hypothetical protein DR_0655 [Deinococcus radiodurans R1 = ATCC 13939 = DSM 20539]
MAGSALAQPASSSVGYSSLVSAVPQRVTLPLQLFQVPLTPAKSTMLGSPCAVHTPPTRLRSRRLTPPGRFSQLLYSTAASLPVLSSMLASGLVLVLAVPSALAITPAPFTPLWARIWYCPAANLKVLRGLPS